MTTGAAVPALVLALLTLCWVAALPRIFFRPGRWNVQWWLNTAPFGLTGLMLLGVLVGKVEPSVRATAPWDAALATGAVVFLAASLGLMGFAMGAHRKPPALWHQDDDPPEGLVRDGPYARIRHPLYTAYLVTLAGGLLAAPHWINLAVLLFVAYRLNGTAAREEAHFLRSPFAAAYVVYMRRTGRFVPWPRSPLPVAGSERRRPLALRRRSPYDRSSTIDVR